MGRFIDGIRDLHYQGYVDRLFGPYFFVWLTLLGLFASPWFFWLATLVVAVFPALMTRLGNAGTAERGRKVGRREEEEEEVQVVIIGAGVSGLALSATLKQRGISHVILEAGEKIAENWEGRYERLSLHTHRDFTALPYVPFPRFFPAFPSRQQVVSYLRSYAILQSLPVRFGCRVQGAHREDGSWRVQGDGFEYVVPHLVVCTGKNAVPHEPTFDGQYNFEGEILHSSRYWSATDYEDKNVLVVGYGNTGMEVAMDLYEQGQDNVDVVIRAEKIQIWKRDLVPGLSLSGTGIILALGVQFLPIALQNKIFSHFLEDPRSWGLGVDKDPDNAVTNIINFKSPVMDVGSLELFKDGAFKRKVQISKFAMDGETIEFVDGSQGRYDVVVLCTGYSSDWGELIDKSESYAKDSGKVDLTKASSDNLHFVGLFDHLGAWREFGLEAIKVANVIERRVLLARIQDAKEK